MSERALYYVGLVEDLSLRSVERASLQAVCCAMQARDGGGLCCAVSWDTFDEMAGRHGTVRDALSRAFKPSRPRLF